MAAAETPDTRSVDRALATPTRSRERRGRGAERTRAAYAKEWKRWEDWAQPPADPDTGRRERWISDTGDVSSELLAVYASALCAAGLAVGTCRKAISGLKSELRSRGKLVPDSLAAHLVVRDHDDTLQAAGRGTKPAEPLTLDGLVRLLLTLDQTVRAGMRDAAILHLLFAGLRLSEAAGLDLRDFTFVRPDEGPRRIVHIELAVEGRAAPVVLLHWRSTGGVHDPRLCPVEAVAAWYEQTASRPGVRPDWPYLRPVDDLGRVAALDAGWAGSLGLAGGRLGESGIASAFARMLAKAKMIGAGVRIVPQSLRLGGVQAKLAAGAAGMGAFAGGAWAAGSPIVAQLLAKFTPEDAGLVALTWAAPPPPEASEGEQG
jgi:hypothetical protein